MHRGQNIICAFWRSNLGSRSWWQAPLDNEPIHGKVCCYFGSPMARRKTRNGSRDSGPLMLHNCGLTDEPCDGLNWLLGAQINLLHFLQTIVWRPRDKCRSLPHLTLSSFTAPHRHRRRGGDLGKALWEALGTSFHGNLESTAKEPSLKLPSPVWGWRAWFPHEMLTFPGV